MTRIHVNRHVMAYNRKHGTNNPAIGVETPGERKRYGYTVEVLGPSRVVHREKPLKCGARCWVETEAQVVVKTVVNRKLVTRR